MSDLMVIAFPNEARAEEVRQKLLIDRDRSYVGLIKVSATSPSSGRTVPTMLWNVTGKARSTPLTLTMRGQAPKAGHAIKIRNRGHSSTPIQPTN